MISKTIKVMNDKRKKLMTLVEAQAKWHLDQMDVKTVESRKTELRDMKHSITGYLGYDLVCDCIQDAGYTRNYAIKMVEDDSFTDWIDDMFKSTKTFDRVMEEWLKAIEK